MAAYYDERMGKYVVTDYEGFVLAYIQAKDKFEAMEIYRSGLDNKN